MKDFRKWVSFNTLISNHEHLYDLYKSVASESSTGGVSFNEIENEEQSLIEIRQDGYDSILELELLIKLTHDTTSAAENEAARMTHKLLG